MIKSTINVPRGIRYISEWQNFNIPEKICILNKTLTGCGFTEWVITSNENVVLCSPRKILLENKEEQHPEVFYFKNELDYDIRVDKDLTKEYYKKYDQIPTPPADAQERLENMKQGLRNYCYSRMMKGLPIKILVTYDSFRIVKEVLKTSLPDVYFNIYIDEFQSIFTDSRFKSSTEIVFLSHLQGLDKVCFVSATPMIDKYLEMLDEFKDLPYFELDWGAEEQSRIIKPNLEIKAINGSITSYVKAITDKYLSGNFDKATYRDESGRIVEIESKEAVIYVNSVKNICDIIRKCGLNINNTNVLCARTPENEKDIKKAFGLKGKGVSGIGKVPLRGEPRKMFTLCTRTVYLGADFYSPCAQSFIFSDANIDCLSVDITTDLPQILGRQRLESNPWKNSARLYYKTLATDKAITQDDFNNHIQKKVSDTNDLLSLYNRSVGSEKSTLAERCLHLVKSMNYRLDYLAVNERAGNVLVPVFNNLVLVSELRTFEIQQIEYKDRFSVFSTIVNNDLLVFEEKIDSFVTKFNSLILFTDKMKYVCDTCEVLGEDEADRFINSIPLIYKNYYLTLGPERIKTFSYRKAYLEAEYSKQFQQQNTITDLDTLVYSRISIGDRYSNQELKELLRSLYEISSYPANPKASDIEKWFEVKTCRIINKTTGKRDYGIEIIKKKDK